MSSILKPKSQHHQRAAAASAAAAAAAVAAAAAAPAGSKNKKLFPQKLWDLINDRRYHFCLRWSEDGQLVYLNRDEFEESYLKTAENQFHTQKAISFVRQMNMYGFRKVDDCYYENDNFKRDCEHLLKNMIRKHPNKNSPNNKVELPSPFSYQQSRAHQMHHQAQQVQQALQMQQIQQEQQALQAQHQAELDSSTAIANLISIYIYAMLNNR